MSDLETPDLCVIGAGAAGLSVAAGAAQMGASTVLIEKSVMGGDCLNYGCVPSKSLIVASRHISQAHRWAEFGLVGEPPKVNAPALREHVRDVIKSISPHDSQERFEGLGVTVIRDAAKFTGPEELEVGSKRIKARRFVVATGSRPTIPDILGLAETDYLTNESVFDLSELPEHLVVIGGGPIGCELGQAFRRLGCQVSIIEANQILAKEDPTLAAFVRDQLLADGINLHERVSINAVEPDGSLALKTENCAAKTAPGAVLVAAGRRPSVEELGLDNAGVRYSAKGIEVDQRLRTSNKRVYALGDVVGGPQFTHAGSYQAGIVIRNALFRMPSKASYRALPRVTYTEPELAQVGLTEAEARHDGSFHELIETDLTSIDRAVVERASPGKIKIVLGRRGQILGAGLVGYGAGELITPWTLAIQEKLKIRAFTGLVAAYPTWSELSKRAVSNYYAPKIFNKRVQRIVQLLARLG